MGTMEIEMAKGRKTGGRRRGAVNRSTLIGKSVSETFRGWLGFDDEAVERTGRISQDGYRARLRLREMLDGDRVPDPAWTSLLKVVMGYAYGNPGKFQESAKPRESLVFVTTNGLVPWDERADPMKAKTDRMLAAKAEQEKLQAIDVKSEPVAVENSAADSEVPEALELVQPPPSPEDFGGGRR